MIKKRILHVVGGMDRGGIETWLIQILQRIDLEQFNIDFIYNTDKHCDYDNELLSLGCRIFRLNNTEPLIYNKKIRFLLRKNGPYDIIHSHVFRFSGYVVRLAYLSGIPVRLVQTHSVNENRGKTPIRKLYNTLMTRWINSYATHLLAVSRQAAKGLFGAKVTHDPRLCYVPPGIDLKPFGMEFSKGEIRKNFRIPSEHFVVGHVGKFVDQKNQGFLVDLAQDVLKLQPNTWFLFVGDGPLRPVLEDKVNQLGIRKRVIFTGSRADVARLLKAMDLFILPSKWEGFGRVLVEAQAAGLPCLVAEHLPREAEVVTPLIRRLSLSEPNSVWAETALSLLRSLPNVSPAEALTCVKQSPFNIDVNVQDLERIYKASLA